jgi:hypothetical protein
LGARITAQATFPKSPAICARAIPLWKAAPSGGAEDLNAHDRGTGRKRPAPKNKARNKEAPASKSGRYKDVFDGLKFGVGVRADFAVQIDLFVLRGNPFHGRGSFEITSGRRTKNNTILWESLEERKRPCRDSGGWRKRNESNARWCSINYWKYCSGNELLGVLFRHGTKHGPKLGVHTRIETPLVAASFRQFLSWKISSTISEEIVVSS